ncbi:MAG: helix-turn-helix domain-containing protein, partial [Dehalococcoidia bacterium]|nr:helix-turn-helix domain-containing protein [Dehalococcoidia bacterium]
PALDEHLLSPREFQAFLGVSRRTFQSWRAGGKLPAPDLHIGRILRWRPSTVTNWLNRVMPKTDDQIGGRP